jgi:hypothetical protein
VPPELSDGCQVNVHFPAVRAHLPWSEKDPYPPLGKSTLPVDTWELFQRSLTVTVQDVLPATLMLVGVQAIAVEVCTAWVKWNTIVPLSVV